MGIAMSGTIDEQELRPALELGAERVHRIVKTGTGAVDEDDGWKVCVATGLNQDAIELEAADIDTDGLTVMFGSGANLLRS
jgi:hypothetical protein